MSEELSLEHLDEASRARARKLLEELSLRRAQNKIDQMFPVDGPLRRELYAKHIQWLSSHEKRRALLGANRVGKTDTLLYAVAMHMTGEYPDWWTGTRYKGPVHIWLGDTSNEQARDVLQLKLLGPIGNFGTGLIRRMAIHRQPTMKRGMADAVDSFYVRRKGGGVSIGWFKSYEQGREAWQGAACHIIAFNEEPPEDVDSEATMRTMTLDGEVLYALTPMLGMSKVVREFIDGRRFYVNVAWDDAPHLTVEQKTQLERDIPPHERDARMRGLPMIGRGAVYQIEEARIVCDDFEIPKHWARGYGMDVGWKSTAAAWGAIDRETDTLYVYSEYERGELEPVQHAAAIRSRGRMTGYIDPAAAGSSQKDGSKLIEEYQTPDVGLILEKAENAREAGIFEVWKRMTSGRLKIFRSCKNLLSKVRLYHRDKHGNVVKEDDHLPDSLRYLVMAAPHLRHLESVTSGNYREMNGVRYLSSLPGRVSVHERPSMKRSA